MKPLLSIEKAANYLSVSKTSLRRWTNEGRLQCVRIGRRGERRFRLDDLDRFLQAPPLPAVAEALDVEDAMAALDQAGTRGIARHVSLHHHGREELWRLFRPYVAHHFKKGAPFVYIHEEGARKDVLERLRSEGMDPEALRKSGLLRLLVPSEAYLRTGSFSPDRMIDFIEAAILDLRALGHTTQLISGEMTWHLSGAPGVDGMLVYEERLNDLLRRYPGVTIVCHYDVERLGSRITLGALCTHPHVQLADRLVAGFYRDGAPSGASGGH